MIPPSYHLFVTCFRGGYGNPSFVKICSYVFSLRERLCSLGIVSRLLLSAAGRVILPSYLFRYLFSWRGRIFIHVALQLLVFVAGQVTLPSYCFVLLVTYRVGVIHLSLVSYFVYLFSSRVSLLLNRIVSLLVFVAYDYLSFVLFVVPCFGPGKIIRPSYRYSFTCFHDR